MIPFHAILTRYFLGSRAKGSRCPTAWNGMRGKSFRPRFGIGVAGMIALCLCLSAILRSAQQAPYHFAKAPMPSSSAALWRNGAEQQAGTGASTEPFYILSFQGVTSFNQEQTSAANTAVSVSIAASAGQRVHLYSFGVRCSAGSANVVVKDGVGGTAIWTSDAAFVGTSTKTATWSTPLASSLGNGMDIVLGACGASNTGTLDVQVSKF